MKPRRTHAQTHAPTYSQKSGTPKNKISKQKSVTKEEEAKKKKKHEQFVVLCTNKQQA